MMPPQIWRPLVILLAILASYLGGRGFFIPPSFYQYGHYRGNALVDLASHPVHFAGRKACMDCHDSIVEKPYHNLHKTVSCETCHGPSLTHAEDPSTPPQSKPMEKAWCARCHAANSARPKSFPQIVLSEHYPSKDCMTCHISLKMEKHK